MAQSTPVRHLSCSSRRSGRRRLVCRFRKTQGGRCWTSENRGPKRWRPQRPSSSDLPHRLQDRVDGVFGDLPSVLHACLNCPPEMNADVDARHGVFVGRLREARIRAQHWRRICACASSADGRAANRERDIVRAEELFQDLRRHATLDGMAGIVIGHRIRPLQRRPVRHCVGIGIAVRVAQPYRGDRPPEFVVILGFPRTDVAVRHGEIQ